MKVDFKAGKVYFKASKVYFKMSKVHFKIQKVYFMTENYIAVGVFLAPCNWTHCSCFVMPYSQFFIFIMNSSQSWSPVQNTELVAQFCSSSQQVNWVSRVAGSGKWWRQRAKDNDHGLLIASNINIVVHIACNSIKIAGDIKALLINDATDTFPGNLSLQQDRALTNRWNFQIWSFIVSFSIKLSNGRYKYLSRKSIFMITIDCIVAIDPHQQLILQWWHSSLCAPFLSTCQNPALPVISILSIVCFFLFQTNPHCLVRTHSS